MHPAIRRSLALVALTALLALPAAAEEAVTPTRYEFGGNPARTNITFVSEADLETIHGITHSVSGEVVHDRAAKTASGRLVVPVASLRTGIDLRDAHLRGEQGGVWLEAAKHPEIVFALERATPSKEDGVWDYAGKLSIHGVTKDWSGKARVRFVSAELAAKAKLGAGDWVRVVAELDVRIADFGIKVPDGVGPKVSEVWKVRIDAWGTTSPPAAPAR
jgi:polyisoprenoid-binding protein YceI